MAKVKWFNRALLESPYCITLCVKESQYKKIVKKLNVKDANHWVLNAADACVHFFESENKDAAAVVCISNYESYTPIEVYGLLLHEAVHIWQAIKLKLREDNPGDELEAYIIQRLALDLMDSFEEQVLNHG